MSEPAWFAEGTVHTKLLLHAQWWLYTQYAAASPPARQSTGLPVPQALCVEGVGAAVVGGGAGVGLAVLACGVSTLSVVCRLPRPEDTVPPTVTEPLEGAVQVSVVLRVPCPFLQLPLAQEPAEAPTIPVYMPW